MSAALARATLRQAARLGVAEFVVCAGSRNSDLVLALAAQDAFRVWSHFEERSAAFFALGRSRALGRPVAVATTSGTAAAELSPAVIEARYQAVPLLLLTADRPKRYRGTGAPQVIDQERLFGKHAEWAGDVETPDDAEMIGRDWSRLGPCHANVCFEEPRGEEPLPLDATIGVLEPGDAPHPDGLAALNRFLERPGPLVVAAGCLPSSPRPQLAKFLLRLGAPIIAEATSGLRDEAALSPLLIRGADQTMKRFAFRRVLRLGGVPSGRFWRDLESREEIAVFSLSRRPFPGLARPSSLQIAEPETFAAAVVAKAQEAPRDWAKVDGDRAALLDELLESLPRSEPAMLRRLSQDMGMGSLAFVGNSLPIREWNLAAAPPPGLRVFANRGANGIDGCVSTFLGLAADELGESWGVFGDLTALYDLAAPSLLPDLAERRVRLVVIQNGGGMIFRRLPHLSAAPASARRMIENPHSADFAGWAKLWGMAHARMDEAWPLPNEAGATVIEVRPDEGQTEEFWRRWQG